MDRLLLHDGIVRRARYVARTLFLPGPHHVENIPLPRLLSFAYVPIKIVNDIFMLPVLRAYRSLIAQSGRARDSRVSGVLALAMMPRSGEVPPGLERHEQARADASHVLDGDSNNAAAWRDLGNALSGLKRHEEAIAVYDRAIALAPDNAANWRDRGMAMVAIGQRKEALASTDKALALDPRDAHAWTIRARILSEFQHFAEAVEACDRAIAFDPENMNATRLGFHCRLFACDWHRRGRHKRQITAYLKGGLHVVTPVIHRGICDSEEESLILARLWAEHYPGSANPLWCGEIYRHDKIRIAYISTDFRDHVVSDVIASCLEGHDGTRFETTAISGPHDGSKMRRRIEVASTAHRRAGHEQPRSPQ